MKEPKSCNTIEEVRNEIDSIDRKIMELLADRQEYVHEVVRFKTEDEESVIAESRQNQLYKQRREWAKELGLSPDMIEEVYRSMIRHNIQREFEIQKKNKK